MPGVIPHPRMPLGLEQKVPWTLWLNRAEFQLAFALQFVAFQWHAYGEEDMPEEAGDKIFSSFGAAMAWAVMKLALEYGYTFEGIKVHEDQTIELLSPEPTEPRNFLYLYKIKRGSMPNPRVAIEGALKMIAQHHLPIDTEPMRVALAEINASIQEAIAQVDPADLPALRREAVKAMKEFYESLGIPIRPEAIAKAEETLN